ncbi:hypothetical protein Q9L58_001255 [Maublancomyces gigas]|uniref:Uncharacterized protein n=1 Tax=Discina gigas TaxID=1032678 RepID=A0ABR3GUT3_9PEZI
MTDLKVEAVQFKLEADMQDPGAEMQATQSMILETSFHTMQAIDGNKGTFAQVDRTYRALPSKFRKNRLITRSETGYTEEQAKEELSSPG